MAFYTDPDVTCCEYNPISKRYNTILVRLHYIYYLDYTPPKANDNKENRLHGSIKYPVHAVN
jgi:hypothetical protein